MAETSIFQANNSSIILNGLYKKTDNLISQKYSAPMSYPNLFKQIKPIEIDQTVSGNLWGKQIRVSLPRSGLLRGLIIQTDMPYVVTSVGSTFLSTVYGARSPGFNIYEKIELRTSSQTLCTNTAQSLVLSQEISDPSKSLTQLKMANFIDSTTKNQVSIGAAVNATATYRTFTCFNCPFFASSNQYFNTSLWENLFLYLYAQPQALNSLGLTTRFNANGTAIKIYGFYEFLNPISLEKLNADMSQLTEAVSMLSYSFYTESTVVTNTTTMQYIVKSIYPAFLTSLDITSYNALPGAVPARANITTVKFDFSGQLYDTMDTTLINYENGCWGSSMFTLGNAEIANATPVNLFNAIPMYIKSYDNPKLWFNLEGKNGFIRNSGALAYQQSNSPSFTLTYTNGLVPGGALATAANYQLFVTHAYYTVTSFNAQSGLVTISATT